MGSDIRQVPSHLHRVEKIFTQRIERHHLNLRTRIQRLTRKRLACLDPSNCIKRSSLPISRKCTSTDWRHDPNFYSVSISSIQRWEKAPAPYPKTKRNKPATKIDMGALAQDITATQVA